MNFAQTGVAAETIMLMKLIIRLPGVAVIPDRRNR
jgi:hypothetical protein